MKTKNNGTTMNRIDILKDLIPKLKVNKKIHPLKIESLEWELKYLESEKKQLTIPVVSQANSEKVCEITFDVPNNHKNPSNIGMRRIYSKNETE